MGLIPEGYRVIEEIHQGRLRTVYRAERSGGERVILKVPTNPQPHPTELAALKQEFEITRGLDNPGVVRAYALEAANGSVAIVLEDFNGESLKNVINAKRTRLKAFLRIAIKLTDILGAIHKENIIHKDIKPENIIINTKTGEIKITDFGIASRLARETQGIVSPNRMEGTLSYMSPEQTGRMNRQVDYRSDFYSLGAVFYEMLTGLLAFRSRDPMELVHAHIARVPEVPRALFPDIPEVISNIVMKLLSKTVEDRYQSAYGLKMDLVECLRQLKEKGSITQDFPLGLKDLSDRLQIPQKLYGRNEEIQTLLEAFARVAEGDSELMLVAGYSGIGKSALVSEIHKPIVKHRGYFLVGKFDQFKRNIPYSALIQAFSGLVKEILTESGASIDSWKDKLLGAVGDNGKIIVDVIPELELIVGVCPEAPELPAAESQNRFNEVFRNFIKVFASPEHPLAIFLDDLQWADSSTLQLIELLMTDTKSGNLFLIGAYRNNEVEGGHPLLLTIDEIRNAGARVGEIALGPLSAEIVGVLISETLRRKPDEVRSLTDQVFRKTAGNPFFVNEFLKSLEQDKLIGFDTSNGKWVWDDAGISDRDITDNVVELMSGKIQKLEEKTQKILRIASCLGNSFDLKTLSLVYGKPSRETAADLWEALGEGMVLPQGDSYRLAENTEGEGEEVSYRFSHDRVQQASYSLIPEEERAQIHLDIGRLLLKNTTDVQENIFDIIDQLNRGSEKITDPEEQLELARLNLTGGTKARDSAAFEAARNLLSKGVSLLPSDHWDSLYELSLGLHTELAESEFLCANYDTAEKLYELILGRARSSSDKAKVYVVQIAQYVQQGRTEDALVTGTKALKLYGVKYNHKVGLGGVVTNLLKVKIRLIGKSPDDILNGPEVSDKDQVVAMQILANMSSPAYFYGQEALLLVLFRIIQISLKHGNAPVSAYAYAVYGFVAAVKLFDLKTAKTFVDLSMKMNAKYDDLMFRCKIYFVSSHFVRHWYEPAPLALATLKEGYEAGLVSGDYNFGAYAVHGVILREIFLGYPLDGVYKKTSDYSEFVIKAGEQAMVQNFAVMRKFLLRLRYVPEDDKYALMNEELTEASFMERQKIIGSDMGTSWYYAFNTISAYLFDDYDEAWRNAMLARKIIDDASIGMLLVPEFYFYLALLCAVLFERDGGGKYKRYMRSSIRYLKRLQKGAPSNYRVRYLLALAEYRRISGRHEKAADLFEEAIAEARTGEYLQMGALANELAGRHYLNRGRITIAGIYIRNSRYAYLRWGADRLVEKMDEKYAETLQQTSSFRTTDTIADSISTTAETLATTHATTESTSSNFAGKLDLDTVLKANQTISGEINLEKLLENMMGIVMENAGAGRGLLILKNERGLFIEAEDIVDRKDAFRVMQSEPLVDGGNYSMAVINYALRTRENIVLDDAARSGNFTSDVYITRTGLKSLLCMPLLYQGEFSGLLYLENNLATGAFTPDRIRILQLLLSQIVISINNANFFARVQNMADSFARFVPRQFLESLGKKSIEDVSLGDAVEKKLTVLFSDIRGFTHLSEAMSVTDNFSFLNSYMNQMSPAINNNNGFVDKFIGDAIMALFPGRPEDALNAVIEMQLELKQFNHDNIQKGIGEVRIGFGLHLGETMLGTVGSEDRLDTTVVGDSVNLASRVESLTKIYRVPVLITGEVYNELANHSQFLLREVDAVRVRGKNVPVVIYELFDVDPLLVQEGKRSTMGDFARALDLYRKAEFPEAAALFAKCKEGCPEDNIVDIYSRRCKEYIANPPEGDWDGISNG